MRPFTAIIMLILSMILISACGADSSGTVPRTSIPIFTSNGSPSPSPSPGTGSDGTGPLEFSEVLVTNGATALRLSLGATYSSRCVQGTPITWTVVGDANNTKLQLDNPYACQPMATILPGFDGNVSLRAVVILGTTTLTYTATVRGVDPAKCASLGGVVVRNLCAFEECGTRDACRAAGGAGYDLSPMKPTFVNGNTIGVVDAATAMVNASGLCTMKARGYSGAADYELFSWTPPDCGHSYGIANYDSAQNRFIHNEIRVCNAPGYLPAVISKVRCGKPSI